MAALWCGEEGAPRAPIYRARAWPELRAAHGDRAAMAAVIEGFATRERKERVVSGAEGIKKLKTRAIGGDATGFVRVWKVFELLQWRPRARRRKAARRKKEREKMTRAR